jgi:hypothetical protein
MTDAKKLTSFEKYWSMYSEEKSLETLSIDDLYKEYEKCKLVINSVGAGLSDIEYNKNRIYDIRKILDDKELDVERLNELYLRKYLSYPDYNNPNFNKDISKKIEFNANRLHFNQQTTCGKQSFELGNHQRLLHNFVNKNTPYKSLLIFHGVGVGKTCSAVKISENFRDINNRIIVLRKGGLGQGWKDTIFDPKLGEEQCSGHELLDKIEYMKGFEKRDDKSIKRDVNKLIKKYYEFYAYREFSNYVDGLTKGKGKGSKSDKEKEDAILRIKERFSNKLLIVDEYHNLRSDDKEIEESGEKESGKDSEKKEQKKALHNLKKIIKYADNLRLILLTATPMYNYSDEIFNLLNLLLMNDNRPIIEYKDYIEGGSISQEGLTLLSKKFKGYVSYLRGENPINFPLRIYPTEYPKSNKDKLALLPSETPRKDLFGKDITDKLKFLNTYENKLYGEQKKAYKRLLDDLDEDKKIGIGDSNLTQICNIYYPSKKNEYGEEGFKSVFNSKIPFSYKKDIKPILSEELIGDYSIKIKNIIDNIKESDGIIFIYSEYIWAGAVPMALALEHLGFNKYGGQDLLNYDKKGKEKGSYIILSGNDKISSNNDDEIKKLKSEENKDGDIIKVVIGSSITGEGMDFKNIRQIHILDPWWHLSKLEQIIGRGIRYCSHVNLPEDKRNVTVFLHCATYDDRETLDHYNYRRGELKSFEIGKVETILKQNAIDCSLFKDANIIDHKNLQVDVKVSNKKVNKFNKSISDEPYSKICSYQEDCKYKCENIDNIAYEDIDPKDISSYKKGMKVSFYFQKKGKKKRYIGIVEGIEKSKNKVLVNIRGKTSTMSPNHFIEVVNEDTINFTYFKDLKRNIINYLNKLFKGNKYFKLDDIVEYIQFNKDIDNKVIYYLLKNIIDMKDTIYDENENPGYIICNKDIYIFQPLYNNDENVPLFYRNNLDKTNKINISSITEQIEGELEKLKIKQDDPLIDDIFNKLKMKYNILIDNNYKNKEKSIKEKNKRIDYEDDDEYKQLVLKVKKLINEEYDKLDKRKIMFLPEKTDYYNLLYKSFILQENKLITSDNKDILFNSCLDELSNLERKVLIKHLINDYKYSKTKLEPGEINNSEIEYLSYEYFKQHFVKKVDGKYVLFNYDEKNSVDGFILMSGKNTLGYYDKNGNDNEDMMKIEIIESLKGIDFNLNNIYISPFILNEENKQKANAFEYTYRLYRNAGKEKDVAGLNSGVTNRCVDQLFKLDLSGFDIATKDKIKKYSQLIKVKLIEIVLRIMNKKDKHKNYVISNELNILKGYLKK